MEWEDTGKGNEGFYEVIGGWIVLGSSGLLLAPEIERSA
jgi:hypothetical protein